MKRSKQQGFTLLELIVSISILALMALLISRIFTESSRAVDQGRGQALLDETARLMLDSMETDISQALIRTNVPFRVSTVSIGDALYCISTAVRRGNETNPRDTAPVRFRSIRTAELVQSLNRRAAFEFASGATQSDSDKSRRALIRQSNVYRAKSINLGGTRDYNERLTETDGISDHAALTSMTFHINGDLDSNRTITETLPTQTDMPRFVDVIIGLVTADEMRQAMRIHSSNSTKATDYLDRRERIYTRRIFMPNTGLTRITL